LKLFNKISELIFGSDKNKFDDKSFSIKPVVIIAIFAGLLVQIISYYFNYQFAYRDSIYRLEAARRFFDAINPGIISQIGTVWLPIPNLIMMPLAAINFFWETGLAGSIVNFVAFVISGVTVFRFIKLALNNVLSTWFGFLMFITNGSILYFQTTSMTESTYICFITVFIYFIFKWVKLEKLKYLFYASIWAGLAAGSRYDSWPVILSASFLVIIISPGKKINFIKPFLAFSVVPLAIIAAWFIYNYIYYGDALEFSRGKFSTLAQLKYYEDAGRLLTKHNLLLSLNVAISSFMLYSGYLFFTVSVIGFFIYLWKYKVKLENYIPYLFLVSFPAAVLLLYLGQMIIELPNSVPPGYFNSRYGLYIFPGICFFTAFLFDYFLNMKKYLRKKILVYTMLAVFIFQFFMQFSYYPAFIPALAEVKYNYNDVNIEASHFLKDNYDGGNLLYDNIIFALYPWSGINLKERISFHTYEIGEKALNNPVTYAKWVMFYKKFPDDHIYNSLKDNFIFLDNYERVFSKEGIEIYKRKF